MPKAIIPSINNPTKQAMISGKGHRILPTNSVLTTKNSRRHPPILNPAPRHPNNQDANAVGMANMALNAKLRATTR
jgi:hypothetical protein